MTFPAPLHSTTPEAHRRALESVVRASPRLMTVCRAIRGLALPDWWIVSGAVYGAVWNALTGRPDMHGVKDIDLIYFDPDTSFEAEDAVIRRVAAAAPGRPPVEARNQARVPLWYETRFGHPYPPIGSALDSVARFASRTHAVAIRLEPDDSLSVHAPFGLDDVFALRLTPNPVLPNRHTYEAKAARQMAVWPELAFAPWPDAPSPTDGALP